MKLRVLLATLLCAFALLPLSAIKASDETAQEQTHATLTPAAQNAIAETESKTNAPLYGYTSASSPIERDWENKLRAIPDPKILRETMQRLSARPHHVGSPYDKQNAEWILSQFRSWGLDAQIETFNVLFPTPKERVLELVAPTHYTAKLQEPPVCISAFHWEQNTIMIRAGN